MRNKTLVLSLLSLILVSCKTQEEPVKEAEAIPVTAALPQVKNLTVYVESIGTLQPSKFMEIHSQVNGILQEVLVQEGEWVQKETPLFKIEASAYEIKVQEAEAQLLLDKAVLKASQKKLIRFKELAQKDLIAQTEWDDLEAEVEKAQAAVKMDEARLKWAKLDLAHCTLLSPSEGRVGKLDMHSGRLINGHSEALATISTMDPLLVEFTITEKEFSKLPLHDLEVEITPLCTQNGCHKAYVTFLDNHFDSKTGLLTVRGKLSNGDFIFRPGQAVRVRIPVEIKKNVKMISQRAIRYNHEGPYVYVVQADQTVAIRKLILGSEQDEDQIVLEGIDPSELVIIEGHLRISPGIKVAIKS